MPRHLLVCFSAAAFAFAALGSGLAAAQTATTLTVVEHATTDATTDTGKKGDSVGDVLTFANVVFDAADTKRVGRDQGYCVRVVKGSTYECTWTLLLPAGHIVVSGPFYDTKDSTLAITGGTGAYKSSRGSMDLHAVKGGKEYRFAYHLLG